MACTTHIQPGIMVIVRDANGADASCGAQALVTATGYSETIQNPAGPGCVNSMILSGAPERPGEYSVTVSKPGFQNVTFTDVVVTAGVCHVNSVTLTASF